MKRLVSALAALCAAEAHAQDTLVTYRSLSPEIALELAQKALAACRAKGFQVAVAVVDRFGQPQVLLRDRFAGAHTGPTASAKAWTAASFKTNTTDLIAPTQPGQPQAGLRQLPGVAVIGGGIVIEAQGSLVGAVGVSGAPGGAEDDACARAGIEAVSDRLDM